MADKRPKTFELTGILATSDAGRLRLCLIDRTASGSVDVSWRILQTAVPYNQNHAMPYRLGAPDDAEIRGECWITLPRGAQARRSSEYAKSLRGREVRLTVRPKHYSYISRAAHNNGQTVTGTSLSFKGGLEPLAASVHV